MFTHLKIKTATLFREQPFLFLIGGRSRYLLEQQALTGNVTRKVAWVKAPVDLTELANLDKSQSYTIPQLAAHFKVGTTTIKLRLNEVRRG